jgi:hypothetical protein
MENSNTNIQSITNRSRVDKFLLVFDLPPILKPKIRKVTRGIDTINIESVQFTIYGTVVPEITVPAIETRHAGSTLYISSHSKNSYPPVQVKFKIDNEYSNYWTIYTWINLLHDQYYGFYNANQLEAIDENFNDYVTDLTIYGKDEFNENRIKFVYKKAFPTTIETVNYNYQEENEIESGFTFVYSQLLVDLL